MLTVLQVAYPLAAVGPDAVGGAEQVLTGIDAALARAGHTSLVLAADGSVAAGELLAMPRPPRLLDGAARREAQGLFQLAIERALAQRKPDVIHLHGVDFPAYMPPAGVPVLVTLHLWPTAYDDAIFAQGRPDTHLSCVSEAQQRACPEGARMLPPIPNGVDLARFAPHGKKRGYALALGRICPEKGFHHALDAARRAGVPLVIAGEVYGYPEHEAYHRDFIVPRLDAFRRYVGAASGDQKRALLAGARCLLVPSEVPETSSLAAMEALASGTPVIAFRSGALPEIVDDGETGYLVRDASEMARAIRSARKISPARCREVAEARFSLDRTADRYLARYQYLAGGAPRGLVVDEIRVADDLSALAAAWSDLWTRCPEATPFQTPEWLLPWWRHLGRGELLTLTVRRAGRLVGLAPMFVAPGEDGAPRRLLLLGTGSTDRMDLLLDPGDAADAWRALRRHLAGRQGAWEVCDLEELPAASAWLGDDTEPLRGAISGASVCPVLELPGSPESFLSALPSVMRRNLRRARERLDQEGCVSLETQEDGEHGSLLEGFFALHAARWEARGEAGCLADDRTQQFHREVARGFRDRRFLRMHGLRVSDRLVAAIYAFCARGRTYHYLGGFDPDLARASPGAVVLGWSIEQAIREGHTAVDFLRGQERYKYLWGAKDAQNRRLRLTAGDLRD